MSQFPLVDASTANETANSAGGRPPRLVGGLTALLFATSLIAAPFTGVVFDVEVCFLAWGRASRGLFPWRIYPARPDCNYPSLWLYVLTIVERLRLFWGASETGHTAYFLLKMPSLIALGAGPSVCARALRGPFGNTAARASAVALALCIAMWVDAAQWGQADVPLFLFLALSAWSLLHERPAIAGMFAGLALALKLQAIVALPFFYLYTLRRFGIKAAAAMAFATALVVAALSAPFFLAGVSPGKALLLSYTGAVGMFHTRSANAFNIWYIALGFDRFVNHLPVAIANADHDPFIGQITAQEIGLTLFVCALLPLLWRLLRTPTPKMLFLSIATGYFSFFMLCTEMHERYILPGIGFLAISCGISATARRYYPAFNILLGCNIVMAYFNMNVVDFRSAGYRISSVLISFAQVVLFLILLQAVCRDTGEVD